MASMPIELLSRMLRLQGHCCLNWYCSSSINWLLRRDQFGDRFQEMNLDTRYRPERAHSHRRPDGFDSRCPYYSPSDDRTLQHPAGGGVRPSLQHLASPARWQRAQLGSIVFAPPGVDTVALFVSGTLLLGVSIPILVVAAIEPWLGRLLSPIALALREPMPQFVCPKPSPVSSLLTKAPLISSLAVRAVIRPRRRQLSPHASVRS
jgi:hypothetical protein